MTNAPETTDPDGYDPNAYAEHAAGLRAAAEAEDADDARLRRMVGIIWAYQKARVDAQTLTRMCSPKSLMEGLRAAMEAENVQ